MNYRRISAAVWPLLVVKGVNIFLWLTIFGEGASESLLLFESAYYSFHILRHRSLKKQASISVEETILKCLFICSSESPKCENYSSRCRQQGKLEEGAFSENRAMSQLENSTGGCGIC